MIDLPQPLLHCGYQVPGPNKFARPKSGYTADQMREYGALCRKQALEEAAKEVDHIMFFNGKTFGEKIRELK